MLNLVAHRQSPTPSPVRGSHEEEGDRDRLAKFVGARIRAAMEARGWGSETEGFEVKRLQDAVAEARGRAPRWQTVQEWILGKTPPSTPYARAIARALGMTLEELMGIALGEEPRSQAWRDFVATPQGASMTSEERAALAAMQWPHGPPDVAAYKMALAAIRSTVGHG